MNFGTNPTRSSQRRRRQASIRRHGAISTLINRQWSFRNLDSDRIAELRNRLRRMPKWVKVLQKFYHKYGLKHLLLLLLLIAYAFLGAAVFYFLEEKSAENKEADWKLLIEKNRTHLINSVLPKVFNNSKLLLFLDGEQTQIVYHVMEAELIVYEHNLGLRYSDQKIEWDFWNAMLYAGTLCTTIGYGHLYTTTRGGRLATMIYALFGIPLVLSILNDLGHLLTIALKYPWMLVKMGSRRMCRYCTRQSMEEIRRLDEMDKEGLEIFDLPIPVAIAIVIGWIFVCSATFCIWETKWDYFTAFYFFFVSLSTIGLGDIVPTQPKMLLMMFGYIIVGLSLVSMCINLIQAKLERTYEKGKEMAQLISEEPDLASSRQSNYCSQPMSQQLMRAARVTLGVLQTQSNYSVATIVGADKVAYARPVSKTSKMTQTILCFPISNASVGSHVGIREILGLNVDDATNNNIVDGSRSIDDVMRLVDTHEGDILVMASASQYQLSGVHLTSPNSNSISSASAIQYRRGPIEPRKFSASGAIQREADQLGQMASGSQLQPFRSFWPSNKYKPSWESSVELESAGHSPAATNEEEYDAEGDESLTDEPHASSTVRRKRADLPLRPRTRSCDEYTSYRVKRRLATAAGKVAPASIGNSAAISPTAAKSSATFRRFSNFFAAAAAFKRRRQSEAATSAIVALQAGTSGQGQASLTYGTTATKTEGGTETQPKRPILLGLDRPPNETLHCEDDKSGERSYLLD